MKSIFRTLAGAGAVTAILGGLSLLDHGEEDRQKKERNGMTESTIEYVRDKCGDEAAEQFTRGQTPVCSPKLSKD